MHAGNGYLIDQFLQDASNQRADHYGGSIENRCRLLWEVLDAVVGVAGADRVGIHISPTNVHHGISDSDPEKLFAVVTDGLNRYGLAYLNVVEGATDPTEKEIPFDWAALRRRVSRRLYRQQQLRSTPGRGSAAANAAPTWSPSAGFILPIPTWWRASAPARRSIGCTARHHRRRPRRLYRLPVTFILVDTKLAS